ncbi:4-(cytidine 5'-diphospho)-2-C-methyl-D-erythritol kinase [Nocardioidaceae bacterium]|nr:4-(cytidine 5'-diphospho)-2-C-methyl-D-erythritol kinase [Nocardioidaceae bacterium]
MSASAPAKINLHLGVGPVREDGFHSLMTVYQALDLRDTVTVTAAPEWAVEVRAAEHVEHAVGAVPAGASAEDNLAVRAGRALTAHHGISTCARVRIDKQIPVAGGMAGGSADAAATLVALDRLWDLGTDQGELHRIAADLGSDVPFALVGGTALGTGRGEIVEQLEDNGTWWWVALLSDDGLATPAVYRRFDELGGPAEPDLWTPWNLLGGLRDVSRELVAARLANDLQPAALDLRPELAGALAAGRDAGADAGIVSGSGPTCVFLAGSEAQAYDVRAGLERWLSDALHLEGADVHRSLVVCAGPAPGARVESDGLGSGSVPSNARGVA